MEIYGYRCCTNLTDMCVEVYILVLLQAYLPLSDSCHLKKIKEAKKKKQVEHKPQFANLLLLLLPSDWW
jgi:hypothetical protein